MALITNIEIIAEFMLEIDSRIWLIKKKVFEKPVKVYIEIVPTFFSNNLNVKNYLANKCICDFEYYLLRKWKKDL